MNTSGNDFLDTLLRRRDDADSIGDSPAWRVGISMAATWSWGAAVAVAIAVMYTKGFVPYLAWASANMVAIPVFGAAYTFIPGLKKWKNLLPMVALWGFIGFFAVVLNLTALKSALAGGPDIVETGIISDGQATVVVIGIGLLIAWFIHKRGLRGSVTTDVYQLSLQFVGALGIIVAGLATTGVSSPPPMNVGDQSAWMVTAVLGLLSGTTASGMQWQRIEAVDGRMKKLRSTLWGGAIFTVFLLVVTIAGYFFWDGVGLELIPFTIAVLAVATSTSDSGSALLQYIGQRVSLPASAGSLVTVGAVLSFPFIQQFGVTAIWTFYASTRWKIVAGLLVLTVLYKAVPGLETNEKLHKLGYRTRFVLPDIVLGDPERVGDEGTQLSDD